MGDDESEVRALYVSLLRAWNERDAEVYGGLFTEDGEIVGYDGSQVAGAGQIAESMAEIFADHETARYVPIVRGVRFPQPGVAVLRAEVGMVPPGGDDIVPERNAVQSMVAIGALTGAGTLTLLPGLRRRGPLLVGAITSFGVR